MKAQWRDWPAMMKAPLKPCYWISSDDSLLKEEALQSLRAAAKLQGFEKETLSLSSIADWDHFEGLRQNFSLFSPKPYYECHMTDAKFKDGIQAHLKACSQTPAGSACIVIVTPKIETTTQKTKWFEALMQDMVWLPLWPLEGEAFIQYVKGLVHDMGLQFAPDAWSLFMTQCTELLSARQTLMRLSNLPSQLIDIKVLQDYLPDTLPCEVFDLADAALSGDSVKTTQLFYALTAQADYQVLMLWALTRDIDTLLALKANQNPPIFPKRKNNFMKAMNRFTETALRDLWRRCAQVDRALKGGKEGFLASDQLIDLYIAFSGATIRLS